MTDKFITKAYRNIGHVGFLILFILSIFFFKERIVFIDNVFYLFKIINFGKFNPEAGRYGSFISQIPVLIALKAKLGLKGLMYVYSASVILIFYGIYVLCTHTLKNLAAGLTILFLFFLTMRESFFHTVHESHQAFVYCALFFGVIQYPFEKKWLVVKYISSALLIILCFYTYPVSALVILFILTYHLIDQAKWKDISVYLLMLLVFSLALFKKLTTPETSYEGAFLSQIKNTTITWTDFFNFYSTNFFLNRITGFYFWMVLVFVILIIVLSWRKEYIRLAFVFISTILFLTILLLIYNKGDSNVMMERSFLPLVPVISIPFFNELVIKRRINQIPVMIILIAVIIAGALRINKVGHIYRQKCNNLNELIEDTRQYESSKFLLKKTEENFANVLGSWTYSFTTLVISSMEDKNESKTIYLYEDITLFEKYLSGEGNIFLGTGFWLEWDQRSLNHEYFNLPSEPYIVLNE